MQISDKTRKHLWGKSGNCCAFCKKELVIEANQNDNESIVAEECHIISSRPNGPRYDASYPQDKLDLYNNLILLCRTHHKMVDDQTETYTTNNLRKMKSDHESWVRQKLSESKETQPIRIRRIKQNIPEFLRRLTTGKEILDIVTNAMASDFDHDELKSQEEVDLIGRFLEVAQDWGDLSDSLEAGSRVEAAYNLTELLHELESAGFFVFGEREVQIIEGGCKGQSDWPVAILHVLRKDNQKIKRVNLNERKQVDTQ